MTVQDISFKGTASYKGLPQLDCQYKSIEKFHLRLIWDLKFTLENKDYGPAESEGEIYSVDHFYLVMQVYKK